MTAGVDKRDVRRGFARQHARTRRFSLGEPRAFSISSDGERVAFLRSASGSDPLTSLWVLDLSEGTERCVIDAVTLGGLSDAVPEEERSRRERAREQAAGVVAYATDEAVRVVACAVGGTLVVADLVDGRVRELDVGGTVVDPRPDPTGTRVSFVSERAVHVVELASGAVSRLVDSEGPDVSWGLAEFVAAEEMGRTRGFWWSPDGTRLAVARVDTSPVPRWHITDPAQPQRPVTVMPYPAAGTPNAAVSLHLVALDGGRVPVAWDAEAFPYLVDVRWSDGAPLTLLAQSRDQREVVLLACADDGQTRVRHRTTDAHWVELVAGLPRMLADGRLLHAVDDPDTRRLAVDGAPLTPPGLQVRALAGVSDDCAFVTASGQDPSSVDVWEVPLDGGAPRPLTRDRGVHTASARAGVTVVSARSLDRDGVETVVRADGKQARIRSLAETPLLQPRVTLLRLGARDLCAALLLPTAHEPGMGRLPVLLDPYGGPHAQRAVRSRTAFGVSQWFAEAGFAVLVADGRGTPGRGPAWERALAGDLAGPPLDDQVDALHAAAEQHPDLLDLDRVAIRGWSFGGYLAALAVLRRPEVFHAAIAGAPVTDWRLYDTHYTERYLGLPDSSADAYDRSSLLADAAGLQRPLLLIHGLADDNVVAAHTLRLSRALLEAGRPHQVLPLVGVTHMTPHEVVAENLLHLQLDFLRRALPGPVPEPQPHGSGR